MFTQVCLRFEQFDTNMGRKATKRSKRDTKKVNYSTLNAVGFAEACSEESETLPSPIMTRKQQRKAKRSSTCVEEAVAETGRPVPDGVRAEEEDVVPVRVGHDGSDDITDADCTADSSVLLNTTLEYNLAVAEEEEEELNRQLLVLQKEEELRRKQERNRELKERIERMRKHKTENICATTVPEVRPRCVDLDIGEAGSQNANNSSLSDNLLNISHLREMKQLEKVAENELRSRSLYGHQEEDKV